MAVDGIDKLHETEFYLFKVSGLGPILIQLIPTTTCTHLFHVHVYATKPINSIYESLIIIICIP